MEWVRYLGKFLISVGIGVLLFVGWTLWGTGLYTAREQDQLEDAFAAQAPVTPVETQGSIGPPESYRPGPGEGVFRLRIPRMDLRAMVVEGVGTQQLRRGPGHYPRCRSGFPSPLCTEFPEIWPGEEGRVVVSGHRTTYGHPFWSLDKLRSGDKVFTDTKWGNFTYEVTRTQIVDSGDLNIVIPSETAEIVLTTCNPRFSAAQRLVVFAEMVPA